MMRPWNIIFKFQSLSCDDLFSFSYFRSLKMSNTKYFGLNETIRQIFCVGSLKFFVENTQHANKKGYIIKNIQTSQFMAYFHDIILHL